MATGAVAGRWLVLPRVAGGGGPSGAWLRDRAATLGMLGGAVLLPALALFFVRQLVSFHDPFATWSEDAMLLLSTTWGRIWLLGVGGGVAVLVGFLLARVGATTGWWLATAAVLAMGAFPAFTGHATAAGPWRPVTLVADVLHVWAAGAWVGGITLLLLLEARWRARREEGPVSLLPALVPAFSPMAVACVATLLVTGVAGAWVHLPDLGALLGSPYGRLLSLKVLLALGVFALGATNWKRLTPRLREPGGSERLRRTAAWELLAAHAVLFVTAILVVTAPPVP